MSIVNKEPPVEELAATAGPATRPVTERITASTALIGGDLSIRRALPNRRRRTVGPWCFLDHFGPADVSTGAGLRVNPHPHIGLQTVTWLLKGEILHRDSLGSEQLIRPGALNLMTAGRGISHSEESPEHRSPDLLGAQLWIALPEEHRRVEPAFDHYPALPVVPRDGAQVTVLAGEWLGERSPARCYSPLLGLDVAADEHADVRLPLPETFEHCALVLQGQAVVEGRSLGPGILLYLGEGRAELRLGMEAGTRIMILGGRPFEEPVLMWWNFVARAKDEILQACRDWNEGRPYLGEVRNYAGDRLTAPLPPWAAG